MLLTEGAGEAGLPEVSNILPPHSNRDRYAGTFTRLFIYFNSSVFQCIDRRRVFDVVQERNRTEQ